MLEINKDPLEGGRDILKDQMEGFICKMQGTLEDALEKCYGVSSDKIKLVSVEHKPTGSEFLHEYGGLYVMATVSMEYATDGEGHLLKAGVDLSLCERESK